MSTVASKHFLKKNRNPAQFHLNYDKQVKITPLSETPFYEICNNVGVFWGKTPQQ